MDPDRILRLTPRQIADIYQHPRDKDGQIILPQPPAAIASLDEMLGKLRAMAEVMRMPADQVKQAEDALRKKYGSNP